MGREIAPRLWMVDLSRESTFHCIADGRASGHTGAQTAIWGSCGDCSHPTPAKRPLVWLEAGPFQSQGNTAFSNSWLVFFFQAHRWETPPQENTKPVQTFPWCELLKLSYFPGIYFWSQKQQDRNKDANVENGLEDTGRGKGKLGRSERVAWTYIHYQM